MQNTKNRYLCHIILILLTFFTVSLQSSDTADEKTLLIVCPAEWHSALTDYIALRKKQGWQVNLLAPEASHFENIHHQICCFFWQHHTVNGHLFLIGDSSRIPFASSFPSSDLSYCFMDGPADPFPDWICGRLPVASVQELSRYLSGLPENRITDSPHFLLAIHEDHSLSDEETDLMRLLNEHNLNSMLLFSNDADEDFRRLFFRTWTNLAEFSDIGSYGDLLHMSHLEIHGAQPYFQNGQYWQSVHYIGDPTLLPEHPAMEKPSVIKAFRSLPVRIHTEKKILSVTIRLQIPEGHRDLLLIREQLPWGWKVQSVLWNQIEEGYAQERNTLKILTRSSGSSTNILNYQVLIDSHPGEIYTIRGNILSNEILHQINGPSVLAVFQDRHVLETSYSPGWNLFCFSAWLAEETLRAYPRTLCHQLDRSRQCWVQCTLQNLCPEQGFWIFHHSEHPDTRLWLADRIFALPGTSDTGWHITNINSPQERQWNWENGRYRIFPKKLRSCEGAWQFRKQ